MEKDLERERQLVPDAEIYVIAAMMTMDLEEILKRYSDNSFLPATMATEIGTLLSRYVESGTEGTVLKSIDRTAKK
jgi:hypothetical protein